MEKDILKELKLENINLKIKLKKQEIENESLINLLNISKNLYGNSVILQNAKERYKKAKESVKQNIILRKYFDTYSHSIAVCNSVGEILIYNKKFNEKFFTNNHEKRNIKDIIPEIKESFDSVSKTNAEVEERFEMKKTVDKKDYFFKISISSIEILSRKKIIISIEDITFEKKLEEEFYHSQKMEAIGRLAGGVAHDFNNILSVILGYSTFLAENLPENFNYKEDIFEIIKATERGTELTRHLLNFSRKHDSDKKILNLKAFIKSLEKFIKRIIGENISLIICDNIKKDEIFINDVELEQVIMNLSVNSKDAINGIGEIKITLENSNLGNRDWAVIVFSDNGCGMTDEVKKRIFEPFFTTKEKGRGTGLGLATVYSVITKNNGKIEVESEIGKGTTFKLYFPILTEKEKVDKIINSESKNDEFAGNGEKILIVDDENDLNQIYKRFIEKHGYSALIASSKEEALKLIKNNIDLSLIITDIILRDGNGTEIANYITENKKNIPVIFITGYTEDDIPVDIKSYEFPLLKKPFALKELLKVSKNIINKTTTAGLTY